MEQPQALPNFVKLHASLASAPSLGEAYAVEKSRVQQLARGMALFQRPDAQARAKLKQGQPVPLSHATAGYSGKPGKAAAAFERVSDLLALHEAQAVFLLRRWLQSNVPAATPAWTPSAAQTRAVAHEFISQRWHALLVLRAIVDAATQPAHASHADGGAILTDLGAGDLLSALLATATGTLAATSAALDAPPPAADGALTLTGAVEVLPRWREQAACELCAIELLILSLLRVAEPSPEALRNFAAALIRHALRPDATALDGGGMRALAARLGIATVVAGLAPGRLVDAPAMAGDGAEGSGGGEESPRSRRRPEPHSAALFEFLTEELQADADAAAPPPPALAALMFATAAVSALAPPRRAAAPVDTLAAAAEAAGVWGALLAALRHEALAGGHERHLVAAALFDLLATAAAAFDLRLAALPAAHVEELLQLLDALMHGDAVLAGRVWSGAPTGTFVRDLLQQAQRLFPVFPRPFVSLLAATARGGRAAADALHCLRTLATVTVYFDAAAARRVLAVRGDKARVLDADDATMRSVLAKAGPVEDTGIVVPLPTLAEGLLTGSCSLVQFTLTDTDDPARSPGLDLVIENLSDWAGRLSAMCRTGRDLEALETVARTVACCATLLSRILQHYRWAAFDLQAPRLGRPTACQALCSAAQATAAAVAFDVPALHPSRLTTSVRADLLAAAAAALQVFASVAAALPGAVLALLAAPAGGSGAWNKRSRSASESSWGAAVATSVRTALEGPAGHYPASSAYVSIVRELAEHLPLSQELAAAVAAVATGVGCAHVQWRWARAVDRFECAEAVVAVLAAAVTTGGLLRPAGGTQAAAADAQRRGDFAAWLLQDGRLGELLQATMSPPCLDRRRSSDFLSNVQARTAALAAAHLRLVVALVDTCAATAPHALPYLRDAYFGAGAGGHAAARILTSHVAACMRAAESGEGRATPLQAVAALAQLLAAGDVAHMHTAIALQPAAAGTSDAVASRAESLDAFKSAIVSALAFHNCVDAPEAANAAVDLLEDSYDAHPSLVSLLLLPTALGLGEAADGQGGGTSSALVVGDDDSASAAIRHEGTPGAESMLDVVCKAVSNLAEGAFAEMAAADDADGSETSEGLESVLPPLRAAAAILRRGRTCVRPAAVLAGQPSFWKDLLAISKECTAPCTGARRHALVHITHAAASGLLCAQAAPPQDLVALVRALLRCNKSEGCLGAALSAADTSALLQQHKHARARLQRAGQAAALAIWGCLDSNTPRELAAHALSLQQELSGRMPDFGDIAAHHAQASEAAIDEGRIQAALIATCMDADAPDELSESEAALLPHLHSAITASRIHEPVLARMLAPRGRHDALAPPVDTIVPQRWPQLLSKLGLPEGIVDEAELPVTTFVGDALSAAAEAASSAAVAAALLSAQAQLAAVASGNARTRSAVADLATDATSTAAAMAATAAVRSAQDSSAHAVAPAAREDASAAAERSWLPVALWPAGAAVACVRVAGHLAELQAHAALAAGRAGDAEDDRSARGGGAGGASQPRRELSFAGNLDRLHSPTTPAAAGSVAAPTGPAAPVSADAALAALAAAQGALEGAGVVGERLHGVARSAAAALPDGLAASAVDRLRDAALLQILAVQPLLEQAMRNGPVSIDTPRLGAASPGRPAAAAAAAPRLLSLAACLSQFCATCGHDHPSRHTALAALLAIVSTATRPLVRHGGDAPLASPAALAAAVPHAPLLATVAAAAESRQFSGGEQRRRYSAAHLALATVQQLCATGTLQATSERVALTEALTDIAGRLAAPPEAASPTSSHSTTTSAALGPPPPTDGAIVPRTDTEFGAASPTPAAAPSPEAAGLRRAALATLATVLDAPHAEPDACLHVLIAERRRLAVPVLAIASLSDLSVAGMPHLSTALLADAHASLTLLSLLARARAAWPLVDTAASATLRAALTAAFATIAALPVDKAAIAGLSAAPVDTRERAANEEPTTHASEPRLHLQTGWFWVAAVCKGGPCAESDIVMPAWARVRSSRSHAHSGGARGSTVPGTTRSPEPLLLGAPPRAERQPSTSPGARGALSPPLTTRGGSRSPSPSPLPGRASPHALTAGGAPVDTGDVEPTRHSEDLAARVYSVARAALRLLATLSPRAELTDAEAAAAVEAGLRPDADALLCLQRQVYATAHELWQGVSSRSASSNAARSARRALANVLEDLLDLSERMLGELRHAVRAGHARSVKEARQCLATLLE